MTVPRQGVDFSVIVPAYQSASTIATCVQALAGQTVARDRYEIIVVDDGSTDGTAAIGRAAGAHLLSINHSGPSAARNRGAAAARGAILVFTDADCEPARDWLERMTRPFIDPMVMGVKGAYWSRQPEWIARLVQLEFEIRYERMAQLPQIDFVDTYAAAYRRDLFLRHGGFDLAYPAWSAEDVDFSFRLAKEGHRLVFVPEARVWHRHPTTLRKYLARKARYGVWRALIYARFPQKIGGDAHTAPALKAQFALVAAAGVCAVLGVIWHPLALVSAAALLACLASAVPFSRWAWHRDRTVALAWPFVNLLRVVLQAAGLGIGIGRYWLLPRLGPATAGATGGGMDGRGTDQSS